MANKSRPIKLTVRVNEDEHKQIKDFSHALNLSIQEYLLQVLKFKTPQSKKMPDELKEIYKELKMQGNNLNQLTRKLNERGYIDYKNELPQLEKELIKTWQSLRRYLEELYISQI